MKILFLTGSLNQGGAEYQILELAKLFKNKGHEIEVFAITDYSFYKTFIDANNIKYSHLLNHQSKVKRIWLTTKKIRKENPEVIISYLKVPSQVTVVARLLSRRKTKLIVGERTSDVRPLLDKIHFTLMRFANFVTVNSISKLNYITNRFPKLRNKIAFFPNIIDIEKFNFIHKKYTYQFLTIGFVGRISPEKNLMNLVKAVQILKCKETNVQLLIYGDTRNAEYLNTIETFIKENRLEDEVLFKGISNNVVQVYKEIDVLCLISDYEGFSNVLSEGLASGLPLITSDIAENRFLVENKENGYVVNQKDPEDIAKGIEDYMKLTSEVKLKMAKTNRAKAEKMFDKEILYTNYIGLINTL